LLLCAGVFVSGAAGTAQADSATQLPFTNGNAAWLAVDPSAGHVFVSGGSGTSSIVVLNYAGAVVKTITGEGGASQMALDSATHTLYVALHDSTAISEINTQTLTETKRFSTAPYPSPTSLVIAGGRLWFSCADGNSGCLVSANFDGTGMATPISGANFPLFLAAGGANNRYLAFGYSEDEPPNLYVYDVSGNTPTLVKNSFAPNNSAFTNDMTFDPTGSHLLLATGAPYYIQSLTTSTLLSSAQYPTGPYPVAVAMTANGKYVAGGIHTGTGSGNDVFVYPVASTTPVRTWRIGDGASELPNHSLAFSPDASRLFAVAEDASTGHLAFHVLTQPTVPLAVTSTSLAGSAKTVRYGSHTSLKVQIHGTPTGKVDLYATTSSQGKHLVATGTVTSGSATFTVTPTLRTTYSAQLEQGTGYATSASQDVTIAVSPLVSVSPRPGGKVRYRGHRVSRTWMTGKVKPQRPANELLGYLVQRYAHRHWGTVFSSRFPILSNGTAPVFFVTNRAGQYRVRVSYSGDTDYAAGKSPWKTFRVRRP
jgi:sugar lactone lactonase YvrE